jgi:uncharacterized protein (TIGR03086 family)
MSSTLSRPSEKEDRLDTVAVDPVANAERSYGIAGRVITGVRPDQLDHPTPCSEWDVRALMNHMIGAHFYFTGALRGQKMDPNATPPDFAAKNPAGTFAQASREMIRAWREPDALDRTVQTLMGPLPATVLIGMLTNDNLVHAWDLSRATGQDENLDPELATQMLTMMQQVELPRGEGAPFKPTQPCPPDAISERKLAAFLGRNV